MPPFRAPLLAAFTAVAIAVLSAFGCSPLRARQVAPPTLGDVPLPPQGAANRRPPNPLPPWARAPRDGQPAVSNNPPIAPIAAASAEVPQVPPPPPLGPLTAPALAPPARLSFQDDLRSFFPDLWSDCRRGATWQNGLILAAAGGATVAIRETIDDDLRANTARHPERWGESTNVLGRFGEPTVQIPALLGLYAYSLWRQDRDAHDLAGTLISAYSITGVMNTAIKLMAWTDRPDDDWVGGAFGFPSHHASSSFAIASVLDEYYGWKVGWPAYAAAGLISWTRLDERDHDLSDVVFGAALGLVVGHTVARLHLEDERIRLGPYVGADDATGLMLEMRY